MCVHRSRFTVHKVGLFQSVVSSNTTQAEESNDV
jgi:hypothetical protein